jgi:hypothetical protein
VLIAKRLFVRCGAWLAACSAFFLLLLPMTAYADDLSPQGWDVQILSYTRGPNYCDFTVSLPPGYDGVITYEYTANNDQTLYNTQENLHMTPDSNGDYEFILYDMQGGGQDTYIKMVAVDDNGDETPLPSYFFVLQMDVAVYVDGISQDTLDELQQAFQDFEDATGVGGVIQTGQALQQALSSVNDFSSLGSGDLSFSVPITEWNGQQVTVTLFSQQELAQYTWLQTVHDVMVAAMWITLVLILIQRFSPIFKV